MKLTPLSDEDTKFLIQAGKSLFESGYSEAVYNRVSVDVFKKFNVKLSSREKMLEGLQQIKNQALDGKNARTKSGDLSQAGQLLNEKIKIELEKGQDLESFLNSYETSKSLIVSSTEVDFSERELIKFNLEVVKVLAVEEYKSSARIVSTKPKCKWYQWACVFYMSTAQLHVLASFQLFNGTYELDELVSAYSLAYIAQCCGFCGCSCKDGCPRFL